MLSISAVGYSLPALSLPLRALSIDVSCSMATKDFSNRKKNGMQKMMGARNQSTERKEPPWTDPLRTFRSSPPNEFI